MAEIALTQGYVAIVDAEDHEWLSQWRWRYKARGDGYQGYAVRTTRFAGSRRQVTIYMHRAVFAADVPEVDHINGDKLDNRRSNLRAANRRLNSSNRRLARGASGFIGVAQAGARWIAYFGKGAGSYLGRFDVPEDAARARDAAARSAYGDFAVLNFPEAV
jgi:hypothetical protein